MATELFIWQPKAPKPERKRMREKGREGEREGEGERERGGNCIIFSNQFRNLKQYRFLCNSLCGGSHKVLPSFKEKKHRFYFLMGNVSKNLQTKQ